jgi:hypothetical protein
MPLFPNIYVSPITYNANDASTDCVNVYKKNDNFIYIYNSNTNLFNKNNGSDEEQGGNNGKMAKYNSCIVDLKKFPIRMSKIVIGVCTMGSISENILYFYVAFTHLKYILIEHKEKITTAFFNDKDKLLGFDYAISLGSIKSEGVTVLQKYFYFKLKQFFRFEHYGVTLKTYNNKDLEIIPDEEKFLNSSIKFLSEEQKEGILKYDKRFASTDRDMLTYDYTRIFTDDFRITEFEKYPLHPEISTIPFDDDEFNHQIENAIIVDFIEQDKDMKLNLDCKYNTNKNTVYFKLKNISMIRDYYNKILLHVLFNQIIYFIERPNSKIDKITYPKYIISKIIIPDYSVDGESIVKNLKTFFSVKLRQFFTRDYIEDNPDITFITLENEILELNNTISRERLETDETLKDLKDNEKKFKLLYTDYFPAINAGGTINKISFRKKKKNKITIFI